MRPIPPKLRESLDLLPRMHSCERRNGDCRGRITWEHAWIYAGSQINEAWAIIGLCEFHHLGAGLDKGLNRFISLGYATADDLKKYPAVDWEQQMIFLARQHSRQYHNPDPSFMANDSWEIPLLSLDEERAKKYQQSL